MGGVSVTKILAAILCTWYGLALAQTAEELLTDGKNTENVTTFGMGYDLKMYSPLRQINKSNVKRLVPVWSFSLANDMGEHSQPTIYNGVMYVVNGNWTFAIDVATGRQIWRTPVQYDRAALRTGGGGAIMRGPATIYNGKLFRQTIDARLHRRLRSGYRKTTLAPVDDTRTRRARFRDVAQSNQARRMEVRRRRDLAIPFVRSSA